MSENMSELSPLEQMNLLLTEKQNMITQEMLKLNSQRQELVEFQQQITEKVAEIKAAQQEIKDERKRLDKEWEQLSEAKANLQNSMNEVLAEKVKQETQSLNDFKQQLENNALKTPFPSEAENFNLNELKASIGIETVKKDEPTSEHVTEEKAKESLIPELFTSLEKEIQKSYSKWTKLELLADRYCLQVGDKEIRFFDVNETNSLPRAQIVVFTRDSKSSNKLMQSLAGVARVAPEWSVSADGSQIICTMPFTRETKVSMVLKKCNEFMKNYLS